MIRFTCPTAGASQKEAVAWETLRYRGAGCSSHSHGDTMEEEQAGCREPQYIYQIYERGGAGCRKPSFVDTTEEEQAVYTLTHYSRLFLRSLAKNYTGVHGVQLGGKRVEGCNRKERKNCGIVSLNFFSHFLLLFQLFLRNL